MNWNIWSIKSKPVRAFTAWLLMGAGAVIVLFCLPFALAWVLLSSIYGGLYGTWMEASARFRDPEWRDYVFAPWWRAASGKERV